MNQNRNLVCKKLLMSLKKQRKTQTVIDQRRLKKHDNLKQCEILDWIMQQKSTIVEKPVKKKIIFQVHSLVNSRVQMLIS